MGMKEASLKIVAEMALESPRWRPGGYHHSGWVAPHALGAHDTLQRGARRGCRWAFADTSPPAT
jgi:hypothetical protein